ncbi:MAG: hypothetical protein EOP60_01720 [Sphingomonadales bacterium]|nr:MAG: hypothetical protein EOP60_01720 [Sphingomonadales bacterium]
MLLAAALLLAGAPDETALFEAFAAPCAHVAEYEKARAEALKGGWEEIADGAEPRLAKLEQAGRDALKDDPGTVLGARYRRMINGRAAFLVISRYESSEDGFWGNGCRVYDFDAPKAIDAAVGARWMGKPPTGTQPIEPGGVKHLWEPWVDGRSFELNYVPANHPAAEQIGLVGVILVAQAMGGFE